MDTNLGRPQITRITQILTTKHTKQTKSLTAGPTLSEGFNDKNKMLIMNNVNGSGGSAVVIASRGANDVMRKLVAM